MDYRFGIGEGMGVGLGVTRRMGYSFGGNQLVLPGQPARSVIGTHATSTRTRRWGKRQGDGAVLLPTGGGRWRRSRCGGGGGRRLRRLQRTRPTRICDQGHAPTTYGERLALGGGLAVGTTVGDVSHLLRSKIGTGPCVFVHVAQHRCQRHQRRCLRCGDRGCTPSRMGTDKNWGHKERSKRGMGKGLADDESGLCRTLATGSGARQWQRDRDRE